MDWKNQEVLPSLSIIGEARVDAVQNLLLSDFCIVLTNFGIGIGEGMPHTIPTHFIAYHVMSVIALYTKTSRKMDTILLCHVWKMWLQSHK